MAILITYDLDKPGQNYDAVIKKLEGMGATRVLYSTWVLNAPTTPKAAGDAVAALMDDNDRILVSEIKNSAFFNLMTIPTYL